MERYRHKETIVWLHFPDFIPTMDGLYLVTYRSGDVSLAKYPRDFSDGIIIAFAVLPRGWMDVDEVR